MLKRSPEKSFRSGYLCSKAKEGEFGVLFHITMKQHSTPQGHLLRCEFEKDCNSILLSDMKRNLLRLNLSNLNYTPILTDKVSFFEFYNYSQEKIYVVSSESQSKLYLVNTVNKKWQRFNLNVNRIVAFQINLLRNLILVADPTILTLVDERTKLDSKVYKPSKSRILKAIFSANNRSLLVLSEDMNLKQLGLKDLEEQFSIILPFDPESASMVIRGDNQHLFVYGIKEHAFLVSNLSDNIPAVSILHLPTKIKQAKFDLEGNLVLLGKDQLIYYLLFDEMKVVRLFNHQHQHVIHNLDISLDNQLLCCISNFGTVIIYSLRDTLKLLRDKPHLFQEVAVEVSQREEQQETVREKQEEEPNNSFEELAKEIPSQSFYYPNIKEGDEGLPKHLQKMDTQIQQGFNALKHKLNDQNFFNQNVEEIVQLIYAFKRLRPYDSNSIVLFFLKWTIQSQKIVKKLSLVLCPQVVTIVEKRFNLDFENFVLKSVCSLFLDYFDEQDWTDIVKFLLRHTRQPQLLPTLFLCILRSISPSIQKCATLDTFEALLRSDKNINLDLLFRTALEVAETPKYAKLFLSLDKIVLRQGKEEEQEEEEQEEVEEEAKEGPRSQPRGTSQKKIQRLLERQEEIEEGINSLRSKRERLGNPQ